MLISIQNDNKIIILFNFNYFDTNKFDNELRHHKLTVGCNDISHYIYDIFKKYILKQLDNNIFTVQG